MFRQMQMVLCISGIVTKIALRSKYILLQTSLLIATFQWYTFWMWISYIFRGVKLQQTCVPDFGSSSGTNVLVRLWTLGTTFLFIGNFGICSFWKRCSLISNRMNTLQISSVDHFGKYVMSTSICYILADTLIYSFSEVTKNCDLLEKKKEC